MVQHPLLIAFVAPAILFSTPLSAKLCPLLPIDDKATVEPLLEGIIATAGHTKRKKYVYYFEYYISILSASISRWSTATTEDINCN